MANGQWLVPQIVVRTTGALMRPWDKLSLRLAPQTQMVSGYWLIAIKCKVGIAHATKI